jgi:hypothetical protein
MNVERRIFPVLVLVEGGIRSVREEGAGVAISRLTFESAK